MPWWRVVAAQASGARATRLLAMRAKTAIAAKTMPELLNILHTSFGAMHRAPFTTDPSGGRLLVSRL